MHANDPPSRPPPARDVLRAARALGAAAPPPEATARALGRARRALRDAQPRHASHPILRRIAMPTGIAAMLALAVALAYSLASPAVSAAEELKGVAEAHERYRGWVHIAERTADHTRTTHINTEDGTLVLERRHDNGYWSVEFNIPARGEQWAYDSAQKEILIGRLSPDAIRQAAARFGETMRLEAFLTPVTRMRDQYDKADVQEAQDGGLRRFDAELVKGDRRARWSVWVDPQSKLVQRVVTESDNRKSELTFRYGEPAIKEIYDLGVPRDAKVTDLRKDGAATRPAAKPERTPAVTGQAAALSRARLLEKVTVARDQIQDLQVSYVYYLTKPRANMVNRVEATVVLKGHRVYLDQATTMEDSHRLFGTETMAFNGRRSTLIQGNRVMVSTERLRQTELHEQGFFEINLLFPPGAAPDSGDFGLTTLLGDRDATVRPQLEMIDGRDCHVVASGRWVLWLDAQRAGLPIRIEYRRAGAATALVTMQVEEAAEVLPGVWLATRGRKVVSATPGLVEGVGGLEYIMGVTGPPGKPALFVNTGVKDEFFDLWRSLPPGVELWDKDEDKSYRVTPNGPVLQSEYRRGAPGATQPGGR